MSGWLSCICPPRFFMLSIPINFSIVGSLRACSRTCFSIWSAILYRSMHSAHTMLKTRMGLYFLACPAPLARWHNPGAYHRPRRCKLVLVAWPSSCGANLDFPNSRHIALFPLVPLNTSCNYSASPSPPTERRPQGVAGKYPPQDSHTRHICYA